MTDSDRISGRKWATIWFVGMIGQLLWNVENALFNTFAYRVAERDAALVIEWMVAASAIASTISTLIMGTWSDRAAKRRPFIAAGFVLWGIFTVVFGATQFLPAAAAGLALVLADTLMSFCGSIGNDAGFNAWTTDISSESNRGKIGGALAVMPVLATIVGTAGFGVLIDGIRGSSFSGIGYFPFFVLIGCVAALAGLASAFLVADEKGLRRAEDGSSYWRQLGSAFNLRSFAENRELFWVFAVLAVYFIGFNVYFPFILPYLEHSLGLGLGMGGIVLGAGLGLAALLAIPAASFIDRGRSVQVVVLAIALSFAGLFGLSFSRGASLPVVILATLCAGSGYVLVLQSLTAWLKNLYPESQRGQFEGVRLIFFVCIPMVLGPAIGTPLVTRLGTPMLIEGKEQMLPTGLIFRVAALVMLLAFVPLAAAAKARAGNISSERAGIRA